jgi:hypothetical protein
MVPEYFWQNRALSLLALLFFGQAAATAAAQSAALASSVACGKTAKFNDAKIWA